MKYAVIVARLLLGLPLALFGGMGLVVIMPDPHAAWENQEGFSPAATDLLLTLWDTGFLMHSVVLTHLVAGVLIILNRFVPLALAVHLPIQATRDRQDRVANDFGFLTAHILSPQQRVLRIHLHRPMVAYP